MWKYFKFSQHLHLKKKIKEAQVMEEIQCTKENVESDQDSAVSEHTPVEDYPIENIKACFDITEVQTHLPQYSENCCNLINIQVILPEWKNHLLPIEGVQFSSASNNM
ncbi:hypothetical protein O181_103313 [Austropuccinia psidii MF-1]|uniref:Uncharacterized protein n=1 Tax=Austropuccinia psidii MF-1 TaxID=1389203 RepID=A0A9Q3PIY4_9BASI|nr:hypothetical protein [Austropuccinia psidii MF-1]